MNSVLHQRDTGTSHCHAKPSKVRFYEGDDENNASVKLLPQFCPAQKAFLHPFPLPHPLERYAHPYPIKNMYCRHFWTQLPSRLSLYQGQDLKFSPYRYQFQFLSLSLRHKISTSYHNKAICRRIYPIAPRTPWGFYMRDILFRKV